MIKTLPFKTGALTCDLKVFQDWGKHSHSTHLPNILRWLDLCFDPGVRFMIVLLVQTTWYCWVEHSIVNIKLTNIILFTLMPMTLFIYLSDIDKHKCDHQHTEKKFRSSWPLGLSSQWRIISQMSETTENLFIT